jgi:hypothetical protein
MRRDSQLLGFGQLDNSQVAKLILAAAQVGTRP